MTTAQIQFAPATTSNNSTASLMTPLGSTKSTFNDMTILPEYAERKIQFSPGENWLRIVPALASSRFNYMMGIHMLAFDGGRYTDPKTLERGAKSVFNLAYAWAKLNCPHTLFSKANMHGVRLLSDPLSICWVIAENEGRSVLRLLQASAYDGCRGGTPGLSHRLFKMIKDHNETGTSIPDAVDAERGVRVCIEKTMVKGSVRPIYNIQIGRQPAPITPMLGEMEAEEIAALVPLEKTVRRLSEEEEWACLEKVMAPDHVRQIRAEMRG